MHHRSTFSYRSEFITHGKREASEPRTKSLSGFFFFARSFRHCDPLPLEALNHRFQKRLDTYPVLLAREGRASTLHPLLRFFDLISLFVPYHVQRSLAGLSPLQASIPGGVIPNISIFL